METSSPGERALLGTALAVALAACLLGQHDRQVWAPDEAREAGITLAMARTGDYVVPRLNGRPFLEKPPLFHATGALVFEATGSRSPFAVRLPAALFGLLTLAATFALGRRIGGNRLGALAVLVLATTGGFHSAVHRAVTDDAIPPFVTLSFLGLALLLSGGSPGWAYAIAGLSAGVAFLAKGVVGPAIIGVGWVAALAVTRRWDRLRHPGVAVAVVLALLPPVAWLLALRGAEGREAVETVLVRNNWDRAAASTSDHAGGPLYYLLRAPAYLLPWVPLAALGAARAWREGGIRRIPVAWLGAGLALLTVAAAKRPIYLLPLVPAAALLAAMEIEARFSTAPALRAAVGALAVLGLAAAGITEILLRPEDRILAVLALAGALGGGALLLRRTFSPALPFAMVAAALAVGFRSMGPAGDEEHGLDVLAAEVAREAGERDLVLYRPSEALEGILTFRMDRDIPAVRTPDALLEVASHADRDLLVVGRAADPRLPEALRTARVVGRRTAARTEFVLVVPSR